MTKEKVALVTGANRGIGLGIVKGLAKEGFHVLLGSRDLDSGKQALKEMSEFINRVEVLELDVSDHKSIDKAVKWVEDKFGKLNVLVNNAGIIGPKKSSLQSINVDELKEVMAVNYYGPIRMNKAFLHLIRMSQEGRIINVSSGMGALDDLVSGYPEYRLSKAGLNSQSILLANELREDGIKVFAMSPGWVRTEMGGQNAPRSVEEGADTAIWLATDKTVETGKFYRDRQVIPW